MPKIRPVSAKWLKAARALPKAEKIHVPLDILESEAVAVARVAKRCWKNAKDGRGTVLGPGLSSELGDPRVVDEVLELLDAVRSAHASYEMLDRGDPAPMDRATFVLRELRTALAWIAKTSGDATLTAQLRKLTRAESSRAHDSVAASLYGFRELAARHRKKLAAITTFDASLIDEAEPLARALREHRSMAMATSEQSDALQLRNRLAMLLLDRVRLLRSTARFVFRAHPALVREMTSAYQRKRRGRGKGTRASRGKSGEET